MTVTLGQLKEGKVDLGHGVTLTPIFDGRKLVAATLAHRVKDGDPCEKVLQFSGWRLWRVKSKAREPLEITPSVWCVEHGVHGWISGGRWLSMRRHILATARPYLISRARQRVKDIGGDQEAVVLAIADLFARIEALEHDNHQLQIALSVRQMDARSTPTNEERLRIADNVAGYRQGLIER